MMALIRAILGKIILALDNLFQPTPLVRDSKTQALIDQKLQAFTLYEFKSCPFCVRVRRELKRLGIRLASKDAKTSAIAQELIQGGGELQVPCLKIQNPDGTTRWLYESGDIIAYLRSIVLA